MSARLPFDRRYLRSLRIGAAWVLLFGVATGLALDMGESARTFECALGAYAALLLLVLFRRPTRPTHADLLFISWGFPLLIFAVFVVSYCLQHWRGAR